MLAEAPYMLHMALGPKQQPREPGAVELESIGGERRLLCGGSSNDYISGRRLAIEDCHYFGDACLMDLTFMLKTLGAYGLYITVIGI
jgi:hypothetical protein